MTNTNKYLLCTWEENGINDSDFFAAYFNTATNEVEKIETGSTRYAGSVAPIQFTPLTAEVLQKSIEWLTKQIFTCLAAAERQDVFEPQTAAKGTRLVLIRDVKHKGVVYLKGTAGEVFWTGNYGHFYTKGYNKPCRENLRVGLRLDGGQDSSKIFVAMAACRLDKEPISDVELMNRAADCATSCQFGRVLSAHFAWDSSNHALNFIMKNGVASKGY